MDQGQFRQDGDGSDAAFRKSKAWRIAEQVGSRGSLISCFEVFQFVPLPISRAELAYSTRMNVLAVSSTRAGLKVLGAEQNGLCAFQESLIG
jgi:hypothetical protein